MVVQWYVCMYALIIIPSANVTASVKTDAAAAQAGTATARDSTTATRNA